MKDFTKTLVVIFVLLMYGEEMCCASNNKGQTLVKRPNIVFIFADDLGYSDVGYNGKLYSSALRTPNIDKLANEGVKLGNYYVQPLCSPTRGQLMLGRYQIHTGLYHSNIQQCAPACLPRDEITLAEKTKEAGYATHMIGKWHLGFYKRECLPTYRGFDTHLGFYSGYEEYFTHIHTTTVEPDIELSGYDFHRGVGDNVNPAWEYKGQYSTFVFTKEAQKIIKQHEAGHKPMFLYLAYQSVHDPMEVPEQYMRPFKDVIKDESRLKLAGMLSCMDESIGNITKTLKESGLYENTIIIFSTDNGGSDIWASSNWPLRGAKSTLLEGGIHGVGFVHSPLLPKRVRGTTSQALIHISDWFPTIVSTLAGGNLNGTKPLDGYDVWDAIAMGIPSPRKELLHNIDPYFGDPGPISPDIPSVFTPTIHAALRVGDWKILTGNIGRFAGWLPPSESGIMPIYPFIPENKSIWLFNIALDPYERFDLADMLPEVVNMMLGKLEEYYRNTVPVLFPDIDLNCNPDKHGGVWVPWV